MIKKSIWGFSGKEKYMDIDKLLKELKISFGLKDKQILIIKTLQQWPLTADQISKQAEIPLSRVYEYLNQLIELKIIEKTAKKPYFYEIKELSKSVVDFMKHHSDKVSEAKSRVMGLMKDSAATEHIEMIDSKEKYSVSHLDLISESKNIKIITHHGSFPFALYPPKWDDFLALRKMVRKQRATIAFADYNSIYLIFKTYKDAFDSKKSISIIVERTSWDQTIQFMEKEFGALYVRHYLRELEKRLQLHEIEAYLCDEHQPIEVDANDNRVAVAIRHGQITTGLMLQSANAVGVFHKLFEQTKSRSIPLQKVIHELKQRKLEV